MKVAFAIDKIEFSIPLGIAYLSGTLRERVCDIEIFEIGNYLNSFLKKIKDFKPDVVAYSVISGRQNFYIDVNKRLKKELSFLSVFGGSRAIFLPEIVMEESKMLRDFNKEAS